ncbi:MAG: hypothetical protein AMXMBFR45_01770 [Gammaproteobacteria bacterium]|nr:MAG: hypothetical protein EDM71_04515 [Pseudomonadota bacterium]MBC6945394.1 hypothetical protein [Gammaproteobacteria bacterium]MCQ3934827.1 hypothetical protein [Gammaproteobacteria bacterium]MDL1881081.1 hypothetical protein [Gammaproteobacteria bacterium PRO2]GIK35883.1 MAG: hypothetical protein BroJett010_24420 [Gammaproteobacteria bacterium]
MQPPLYVKGLESDGQTEPIELRKLSRSSDEGERFSESWLQKLVDRNPRVLPIAELDEARFVDAITRNLRRGRRILLLVVGDGIREGAETLGEYLQLHAGFHIAFGLVEMPVFELPTGGDLVQPRVLARTVNIEHGIFVEPAPKSLMVRWPGPDDSPFSLGGCNQNGGFDTETVNWRANDFDLLDLAHEHLEGLARLVGGAVRKTRTPASWYVVMPDGKPPSAMDILQRRDDWIKLIPEYGGKLNKELQTRAA